MRTVACRSEGCSRADIVRTVHDTAVAPGIVTRPTLICAECGAQLYDTVENGVDAAPEDRRRRQPRNMSRRAPETR